MSGVLRKRNRRIIDDIKYEPDNLPDEKHYDFDNPSSDIEIYAKEVLTALIADNLPPTPNNFLLYFDRLLDEKSEALRRQIRGVFELEESSDAENTIVLEQNLKRGFLSIKNILNVTANLYKNMALMTKILEKRKAELSANPQGTEALSIIGVLESDVSKLNSILKTQSSKMKEVYDETAEIVRSVENKTIFDDQFGVYNKRYLMKKIEQEIGLISEFKHKSSLMMIELDKNLKKSINNDKAVLLMTRAIARLLLKTSRRSDVVAHYSGGVFAMLLKHTDIKDAKRAAMRLSELVSNSNFFLADREIQLKISIGVTIISDTLSVEEIVVAALDGIQKAYGDPKQDFATLVTK